METMLDIGVGILRLMPLILAFYIPALLGMATWSEGGRTKAILWFAIGFGAIVAVQALFSSVSAIQVAGIVGLSLVQIAAALSLAALTVYKLANYAAPYTPKRRPERPKRADQLKCSSWIRLLSLIHDGVSRCSARS